MENCGGALEETPTRYTLVCGRSVRLPQWEQALAKFLSAVSGRVTWMLVGSAATRLHGVLVDPGDIDILFHPETSHENMLEVAESFGRYAFAGSPSEDLDLFLSTPGQPLATTEDGSWLFGRWLVEGCKLELARIRVEVGPNVVLETMGPAVWEFRQHLLWRGELVPVVPLEVQLATIISRGQAERSRAVHARLVQRGADDDLIARAMNDRGLA